MCSDLMTQTKKSTKSNANQSFNLFSKAKTAPFSPTAKPLLEKLTPC